MVAQATRLMVALRKEFGVSPKTIPAFTTARAARVLALPGIFRGLRCRQTMHWIAPSEKDAVSGTLGKRVWHAAGQFRANSGLESQEYSGGRPQGPVLGLNRRAFIHTVTVGATSLAALSWTSVLAAEKTNWPIGCFNRAWTKWSYDDALDGIAAAGYKLTGLLSAHRGEAFTSSAATPEYLDGLKKRSAQRGLAVNMTAIRFRPDAPLAENIADLRQQIENAARLELQFMLTFGVDQPAHYENFYRLMAGAAAQTEKRGLHIVLKPHGGGSGASEEILRCLEKVAHANFKIWYDAGNIIYYTGKDPLAELEPITRRVTGFCAKDCLGPKGEVMSQFGTGKVDFKALFAKLKSVGFNGPIMVEGVKVGATAGETTANARANREFLEKTLASS